MTAGDQQRSQCFWTVDSPPDAETREDSAMPHHRVVLLRQKTLQTMIEVDIERMSECCSMRCATSGLVDNEENGVLEWAAERADSR